MAIAAEYFTKGPRPQPSQKLSLAQKQQIRAALLRELAEAVAAEQIAAVKEVTRKLETFETSHSSGTSLIGFTQIPHVFGYKYLPDLSDGAFRLYYWLLFNFGYEKPIRLSYRRLRERTGKSVPSLRKYVAELSDLALVEVEWFHYPNGRNDITQLTVKERIKFENNSYLEEHQIMKPRQDSADAPLSTPTPARALSLPSEASTFSSSFLSEKGEKLCTGCEKELHRGVKKFFTQTKKIIDQDGINQEERIRSGHTLTPSSQTETEPANVPSISLQGEMNTETLLARTTLILTLMEKHLDPLSLYTNGQRRKKAEQDAQSDAYKLAQHPAFLALDAEAISILFAYLVQASKYGKEFHERYSTPIQGKHLLTVPGLLEQCLGEIRKQNWKPDWILAREWEETFGASRRETQPASDEQPSLPPVSVEEAPNVTEVPPACDIFTEKPGEETPDAPDFSHVEGMLPREAYRLKARIREFFPELEPLSYQGLEATKVLTVMYDGVEYLIASWEDYQGMRQLMGLMPDTESLLPDTSGPRKERIDHTKRSYLQKCTEWRERENLPIWDFPRKK